MYDMDFRKTLYVVSSHQSGVGSSGDNFVLMFVVGNIVSETKFLKSAMLRWYLIDGIFLFENFQLCT